MQLGGLWKGGQLLVLIDPIHVHKSCTELQSTSIVGIFWGRGGLFSSFSWLSRVRENLAHENMRTYNLSWCEGQAHACHSTTVSVF